MIGSAWLYQLRAQRCVPESVLGHIVPHISCTYALACFTYHLYTAYHCFNIYISKLTVVDIKLKLARPDEWIMLFYSTTGAV